MLDQNLELEKLRHCHVKTCFIILEYCGPLRSTLIFLSVRFDFTLVKDLLKTLDEQKMISSNNELAIPTYSSLKDLNYAEQIVCIMVGCGQSNLTESELIFGLHQHRFISLPSNEGVYKKL